MRPKTGWREKLDLSGTILFVVLVAVAYASMFVLYLDLFTTTEVFVLIVIGVTYTIIGIYGERFCQRENSLWATLAYFAIQIPLGTAIFYLSHGLAWLVMLPLAGESVDLLWTRRRLLAVVLVILISIIPVGMTAPRIIALYLGDSGIEPETFFDELMVIAQLSMQYALAVVFTVLFTYVAVREQETRAKAERLADELTEANRRLREYAVQIEELATVKERNRLAREIHDTLGHYLTVVNVQIEAARTVLENDRPRALDALGKAQALAQDGLGEVRRSVAALRAPPMEGHPLPEAVTALVDECRAAGVATEFTVNGKPRPLPPQAALTLYRAVQEGLTNVRRHAQVSSATVTLDYRDDGAVRLAVQDDGVGSGEANGGFGLLGVRERAQLLGGQVSVRTAPGQGFTLEVEVPG